MKDILEDINEEDLVSLRDLYKEHLPETVQPYLFLQHWIRWKSTNPNVRIEFTCPEGNWKDGTFIAIVSVKVHFIIVIYR